MNSHMKYIVVLVVAIAALYGQFLWNPLVFDDLPFFIASSDGHQAIDDYPYSPFELRSLPYASFGWSNKLFGFDMFYYRIENLLLHMAVAVSMYLFLMRLFPLLLPQRNNGQLTWGGLAFCAALLFSLHPVAVYAVGYLIQRTILMATLFSLLAMLAWLYGTEREKSGWLWASVFFYYLAVFSKEHAVALPAILLALTILIHADWRDVLKRRWKQGLALFVIAVFVFLSKLGTLGSAYEVYAPEMLADTRTESNYPLSILTQSWLFFKYAGLWLFPNPNWMSVDMREPFAPSLWSPYAVAFFAFWAWGAMATVMLVKRGRWGLLGFAMLFPWLMFFTEFSTIRIQESFVLYRSYLWAVGACAVLPLLVNKLDKSMARIVLAALALAMMPISMDRLASFAHPLVLWDDAAKLVEGKQELPGVFRIYYNRGSEFIKVDEYGYAIEDLKLAASLNPEWPFSYSNLGLAYIGVGDWSAAASAFSRAIEIADKNHLGVNPKPFFGRAMAYEKMGQSDLARSDFMVTCKQASMGCDKLLD